MKTIIEYFNEAKTISPELQEKMDLADDISLANFLKCAMNNWYHYLRVHKDGTNNQKFKKSDIYNFRTSVKRLITGQDMGNMRMHNEELVKFTKDLYDEMFKIKPEELDAAMSALENAAPKLGRIVSLLKKQNKPNNDLNIKESLDDDINESKTADFIVAIVDCINDPKHVSDADVKAVQSMLKKQYNMDTDEKQAKDLIDIMIKDWPELFF